MLKIFFRFFVVVFASVFFLSACYKKQVLEVEKKSARQLYSDGIVDFKNGDTDNALLSFNRIDVSYPYTVYSGKGMLMSSYIYYLQEKYNKTISIAQRYIALYSASPEVAYAKYLVGRSYAQQIGDVYEDQTFARKAEETMNDIITSYPNSVYVLEAKKVLLYARDQQAGKEMAVGRFYQSKGNLSGAISRFKLVVLKYPRTVFAPEAYARIIESYLSLGVISEAQKTLLVMRNHFSNSEWYKYAFGLLSQYGGEGKFFPRPNEVEIHFSKPVIKPHFN